MSTSTRTINVRDAQDTIKAEIEALREEKRTHRRFSSQWHRVDAQIQALLWVKQTVLR